MFIKLMIVSVVLVALIMLALGLKLWFDPGAEYSVHSCAFEGGSLNKDGSCSKCQLKDLANCPENEENKKSGK